MGAAGLTLSVLCVTDARRHRVAPANPARPTPLPLAGTGTIEALVNRAGPHLWTRERSASIPAVAYDSCAADAPTRTLVRSPRRQRSQGGSSACTE